jgi:hypothetical protein
MVLRLCTSGSPCSSFLSGNDQAERPLDDRSQRGPGGASTGWNSRPMSSPAIAVSAIARRRFCVIVYTLLLQLAQIVRGVDLNAIVTSPHRRSGCPMMKTTSTRPPYPATAPCLPRPRRPRPDPRPPVEPQEPLEPAITNPARAEVDNSPRAASTRSRNSRPETHSGAAGGTPDFAFLGNFRVRLHAGPDLGVESRSGCSTRR